MPPGTLLPTTYFTVQIIVLCTTACSLFPCNTLENLRLCLSSSQLLDYSGGSRLNRKANGRSSAFILKLFAGAYLLFYFLSKRLQCELKRWFTLVTVKEPLNRFPAIWESHVPTAHAGLHMELISKVHFCKCKLYIKEFSAQLRESQFQSSFWKCPNVIFQSQSFFIRKSLPLHVILDLQKCRQREIMQRTQRYQKLN